MKNFYAIVGVPPSSTIAEIRAVYRTKAKTMHPDAGGDPKLYAALTEAIATLTDFEARKAYDAKMTILMDPCAACKGAGTVKVSHSFTTFQVLVCATCGGEGYHERR